MRELLSPRKIDVVLSARPGDRELGATIATLADAGIDVVLWPMLADADGRWANVVTAARFAEHVCALVAELRPARVLFDLEPPIAEVRAMLRDPRRILRRRSTSNVLFALANDLVGQGVEVAAAVAPLVALDGGHLRPFERLLGTPVAELPFARVSTMLYASLFEGYGRGLVDRPRAERLLDWGARATRRRFGPRASVSVGAVGPGALGDERPYVDASELARDVAIARAAGVRHLALFDLAGVLARPPAEAWLDAFVEPA